MAHTTSSDPATRRHRPKTLTVFAAAFAAGAVLAYGVDRVVDVHVVQVEPQVESEPIFVALRSLPQGAPLTVWDVALKDWPKAMLPTTALKADAALEGMVLRHPIREGQPLLSVQLVRDGSMLPIAGMAALPPAGGTTATGPVAAAGGTPAAMASQAPVATETFVPAAPAESPVAATPTAPLADATAQAEAATATAATVPEMVATDTDIDPSDSLTAVPSDVDSEAVAADAVALVEPAAAKPEAAPALVPIAMQPPAETAVNEPTPAEPAQTEPRLAGPAATGPLVAPVPALPTTDIGRSLAAAGRGPAEADVATTSVLDRKSRTPAPQAPPTAPRYHLVVPERVALAADTSFAQRPTPPVQATPAARTNPAAKVNPAAKMNPTAKTTAASKTKVAPKATTAPTKGTAESQRAGGRRSRTSPTASGRQDQRQERSNAAARKAQPNTRQPAAGTTPADQPQASRPLGLGAWFPQFSSGSRQR